MGRTFQVLQTLPTSEYCRITRIRPTQNSHMIFVYHGSRSINEKLIARLFGEIFLIQRVPIVIGTVLNQTESSKQREK